MSYFFRRILDILTAPLYALLSAPGRILAGSRRLASISLPAQVALLSFPVLILCVVIALVVFWIDRERSGVFVLNKPIHWVVIVVLVFVIPYVLYKTLQLWLEGEVSQFPDIAQAWKAGMAELDRQGLNLREVPVFLVLGTAGNEQEKNLFDAARLNLNFREVPQGPSALHWYGSADGVYLVCSDVGCLTKLATLGRTREMSDEARPAPVAPTGSSDFPMPAGPAARPRDQVTKTMMFGQSFAGEAPEAAPAPQPEPTPHAGDIRGTMVADDAVRARVAAGMQPQRPSHGQAIRLDLSEATLQERRLEYVCQLLRRARRTVCPANGVLTLLPYRLIQSSVPEEASEVQRAAKRDTATLLRALRLRCPVTALVVGLEEESGFRELVRRVERDRVVNQRFGKGHSLQNRLLPERLEAVAAHACGAFEDWAYALFREKGSLNKPNNAKLFALVCKIRGVVAGRLARILSDAYSADPNAEGESLLFGGCYFAATGSTEDRQAFVKGVFDKFPDQQGELEWSPRALAEDERYQVWARASLVLDTAMLLVVAYLVYQHWR
jgi:hypothetical protein